MTAESNANVGGAAAPTHFIKTIVERDLAEGRNGGAVRTRFPPEPNGYLHIGHAKAICIDFGIAAEYGGACNLRFDDTNPIKEEQEYIDAIKKDVRWLGFDWQDREFYASDYFEQLYGFAVKLIEKGKAYVDDLSAEEIRAHRGTLTEPGRESPYRNRPVAELGPVPSSAELDRLIAAGRVSAPVRPGLPQVVKRFSRPIPKLNH